MWNQDSVWIEQESHLQSWSFLAVNSILLPFGEKGNILNQFLWTLKRISAELISPYKHGTQPVAFLGIKAIERHTHFPALDKKAAIEILRLPSYSLLSGSLETPLCLVSKSLLWKGPSYTCHDGSGSPQMAWGSSASLPKREELVSTALWPQRIRTREQLSPGTADSSCRLPPAVTRASWLQDENLETQGIWRIHKCMQRNTGLRGWQKLKHQYFQRSQKNIWSPCFSRLPLSPRWIISFKRCSAYFLLDKH